MRILPSSCIWNTIMHGVLRSTLTLKIPPMWNIVMSMRLAEELSNSRNIFTIGLLYTDQDQVPNWGLANINGEMPMPTVYQ